jgi:hypothetical protein
MRQKESVSAHELSAETVAGANMGWRFKKKDCGLTGGN